MKARTLKILVTGFEPFGGEEINPTALLVEALGVGELKVPAGVDVRGLVIPVVFGEGFAKLQDSLRTFRPDVVLALGQAGGRSAFAFERVAVNLIDGDQADNAGVSHCDQVIDSTSGSALFSTLPIRALAEKLTTAGVPARISNSAGLFVCNEVFFRLQATLLRTAVRSGFVHVPYLPAQAAKKEAPSMELGEMKRGLELILEHFAEP
ncbi:MAG: pyroglutamyl-peptidase I [Bdellovibrionota bacterium]